MNLRVLEALADTFSTWDFQFKNFLIVTSRYLAVSADFSSVP